MATPLQTARNETGATYTESWEVRRDYQLAIMLPNGTQTITVTGHGATPEEAAGEMEQHRLDLVESLDANAADFTKFASLSG